MRVATALTPGATAEVMIYPTSDGRRLRLSSDGASGKLRYQFELGFAYRDPSEELPTDAVECRFWLADAAGRVWTTRCRFLAKLFVSRMLDLDAMSGPNYLSDKVAALFETALLLEGARYSSDDRIYRHLLLGDEVIKTQFKYSCLTFDVAYAEEFIVGTKLWVRLREGSLFTDGDPIAALCFSMKPHELLAANRALPCEEEGHVYWEDSYLPVPLGFEPTGETDEPNPHVVLL